MDTLHWCCIIDPIGGLLCNTISLSVHLLDHPTPQLRAQAARLVFDLTVPLRGKRAACEVENCTQKLSLLLVDDNAFVRAQAAAALMRSASKQQQQKLYDDDDDSDDISIHIL